MHISEGVLSMPVLAAGAVMTAAGTAVGLKKMNYDRLPQVAILSAVFFLASLVHLPIGPASIHLVLTGLLGILLGWSAFPAILIGLALQGVLFQYGGLTSLGLNTLNMALPAVLCSYLFGPWTRRPSPRLSGTGAFLAGFLAIFLSSLMVGFSLVYTGESFLRVAKAVILAHIPAMIIEGIITVICVQFLKKVKPEVLDVAYTA